MTLTSEVLDHILGLQLTVARLGERELRNWWNTDLAHHLGGADFLGRLLGPTMASLAVLEGLLLAARLKEEALLAGIMGQGGWSLFCPEPALAQALNDRIRHLKSYPGELPATLAGLLEAQREWSPEALIAALPPVSGAAWAGTSFGRELQAGAELAEPQRSEALAAELARCEKGRYVLAYYRSGHGG